MPTPPDWTATPAMPAAGWRAANVAFRRMPGPAMPRQFGPTSRIPWRRQQSSSACLAARSSPEVITTSAPAPRSPHSSATRSTAAAGTASTARSTGPGSAAGDGGAEKKKDEDVIDAESPSMSEACGFTACTRPPKPPLTMLCRIARPTDPGRRLAPTTATDSAANRR